MDARMSLIEEAEQIINNGRQDAYGSPAECHGATAAMWSAYLQRKLKTPVKLTARDVCWLNTLQKASRDAHSPKRDNLVDVIGWTANVELAEDGPRAPSPRTNGHGSSLSEEFAGGASV
jgi:hypothetical protein